MIATTTEFPLPPVSKLFLPPTALAGCVFAAVFRDTRGADLLAADRVNHFPASPLVSVTSVIHGTLTLLPSGSRQRAGQPVELSSAPLVMGPQDMPVSSVSPGDVTAVSIGIYPDAWLKLGGDRAFQSAPFGLAVALERFRKAKTPELGWQALCDVLTEEWAQRRPRNWAAVSGIGDWASATMARAALAGPGRSLRSFERRLRRMSRQTRRSLNFYAAFETLHKESLSDPDRSLADTAYASGYADQSHMGRAVRRATGLSPARLNQAIETEEPFWCYRLLGERF